MTNYKFIILIIYLLIPYLLVSLLIFGPIAVLNLINKKYGFRIKNMYMSSLSFFVKYYMGIEIFTNSNSILKEIIDDNNLSKNILISNHPTEIDFLIFPFIINNIYNFYEFKYISMAKKTIGYVLSGLSMASILSKDLLLDRDINHDIVRLKSDNNCNLLFLYPEGTCFSSLYKKKSDIYTRKNKLPNYNYHLYPRITGLEIILKNHKFNNIYDMTIVYDSIPKEWYGTSFNLLDFINKYRFPTRIYIKFDKYILHRSENIKNLLELVYRNKDNFISSFNPNSNKFKAMTYNYLNGLISFICVSLLFILSLYLFLYYSSVRIFYSSEIIIYYIYIAFVY